MDTREVAEGSGCASFNPFNLLRPTRPPDAAARVLARSPDGRRPQVMRQRWESLLFLHWRLSAERVQATLPPELTVDTFDGHAYLGVVPFLMRNVRPVGVPRLPWLSNFHELNVRTYAYDAAGVPGVWFYSLSCDQPIAVWVARAFTGLNYVHAAITSTRDDVADYCCRRAGSEQSARYRYRPRGAARVAQPDSLEFFLLERYYLFARHRSALVRGQVAHLPYQFREAELLNWSAHPAELDGYGEITGEPMHVCYVDGLDVNIYAPARM